MTIQLNADKNLNIHEAYREKLNELINKNLGRFSEHITRVEVHFTDENSDKPGNNDKKCVLETRLKGMDPSVVKHHGDTYDLAIQGALDKMKVTLDKIFDKLKAH